MKKGRDESNMKSKRKNPGRTRKSKQDHKEETHGNICGFFSVSLLCSTYKFYLHLHKKVFSLVQKKHSVHLKTDCMWGDCKCTEQGHSWACWSFRLGPPGQAVERGYLAFASEVRIKGGGAPGEPSLNVRPHLDEAALLDESPVAFSRFL